MQRPCALERDFTAGNEQVQVGSLRQFDAVARLQARAVQRRVPIADRDGGVVAMFGMPDAIVTRPRATTRRRSRVAGSRV